VEVRIHGRGGDGRMRSDDIDLRQALHDIARRERA
jgi:hypothetical protein